MAAPLPKEVRAEIIEYLKKQDLSGLSSREIAELIEENLGFHVSQPTASKFKYEIEEIQDGESAEEISISEPPMVFDEFRESCREFFSSEGLNVLYEMARNGSNHEKLDALKLILYYGYGRPKKQPDMVGPVRSPLRKYQ
jgi:hypothetical protein